jgi:hypothetical protein
MMSRVSSANDIDTVRVPPFMRTKSAPNRVARCRAIGVNVMGDTRMSSTLTGATDSNATSLK